MSVRDVVIVGGGPAGSASALQMARAGLDVVLIDRQQFPRAKACGDCISPGANRMLRRLGVWEDILAERPARLAGWLLDCGAAEFSASFDDEFFSLAMPRARLDAILLAHAQRAGVTVQTARFTQLLRDGDEVTGIRCVQNGEQQHIRARLVVGADGLRSRVARELHAYRRKPRLNKVSLTTHLRGLTGVSHFGEMHVRGASCLGIARVEAAEDPLCNVTVVLKNSMRPSAGPHEMMRAALRDFGRADIAQQIADSTEILASGPFDWPVGKTAFPGAALVGDAAGYFDPFTGQGIYQALEGAELLSAHAVQAFAKSAGGPISLSGYAVAQRTLKGNAHRLQHVIDSVCAHPRLTALAFRAFARSPELAATLVAVTGDLRPARALLSPRSTTRLVRATLASLT